MYCARNNRIYCSDCSKFYIPNNYANHLKSKGQNINVMRKSCCTCNNYIIHSINHNLTCSMNKVCLESNKNRKTEFSNVKNFQKNEQTRKKISINIKNIDPGAL